MDYQPEYDEDLTNYIAIGSNGGIETFLISIENGSIYVCDLISGSQSLEKIASTYNELKLLLSN